MEVVNFQELGRSKNLDVLHFITSTTKEITMENTQPTQLSPEIQALADELKAVCRKHDWNADYSDDYSVWSKSQETKSKMDELFRKMNSLCARELYKSICSEAYESWNKKLR